MQFKFLLLIIASAFALSACQKKTETPPPLSESEINYQIIQDMIQKQELNLAENELTRQLKKQPKDNHARVLLASVYLQRAGVTIRDYFLLNDIFSEKNDRTEKGFLNERVFQMLEKDEKNQRALSALRSLNEVFIDVEILDHQLSKIPLVTEASSKEVYHALRVLEKLESAKDGDRLYRGLVKIIYFKYLWSKGSFLQLGSGKLCKTRLKTILRRVQVFGQYVPLMIEDVSYGMKKNQQAMQSFAQGLRKSLSDTQLLILSLGDLNRNFAQSLEAFGSDGLKCDF